MADAPLLELEGITKQFSGVLANDRVDLDLQKGEVHALLGENGAGKSTLMNILYGLYHPDEGEIRVNGEPIRISSPRDAIDRGIGMVHQRFMLIPVMTVAENIVLATEPRKGPLLDIDAARERVRELLHVGRPARRSHAAGGAGALRDRPLAHRAGRIGDLHLAQAERGARDRR